jgi:hypothetical protein
MKRGMPSSRSQGQQKKSRSNNNEPRYSGFENDQSVHDETQNFLLGTARFPVDALTARWSLGENRSIDRNHVKRLCKLFKDQGVRRSDVECHIIVGCTRQQHERMLVHTGIGVGEQCMSSETVTTATTSTTVSFSDWEEVNECKAELLAGNHRVEALKELLKGSDASERWWTAQIYDIGGFQPQGAEGNHRND